MDGYTGAGESSSASSTGLGERVMPARVAIVSDWFAPRLGGIEAQLVELCERLGQRGAQVDVLTATPGARDGRNFHLRPLDLLRLPWQDVVVSPLMLERLRGELSRGYDIVHAHVSVVSPVGYAGAIAARDLGLPVVVTFHSVLRTKALLLRLADAAGRLGESAVHWTAVSTSVARQVSAALSGIDVPVLSNGVDLRYWGSRVARPISEPVTLVSTMRLQRKKRPRQLVRAYAQASARSRARSRLVLIGDGPDRGALERDIAVAGLANGQAEVELLGWLDRDAIRDAYEGAHGFVMASTAESFGIAALEARAAGLPVITMAGGSTEFLTHDRDALICDSDEELAFALTRFISDPALRQRLAVSTPDLRRHDWDAVVTDHEAAYATAIRKAGLSGAVATSA